MDVGVTLKYNNNRKERGENKNVDIKYSAHGACLEEHSSGTLTID